MSRLTQNIAGWFNDHVLKRVVVNSAYLIASNLISVFLTIYITRLLGVYNYGVLGIITSYVTNVNKFFSFRMNEMVIRFVSEAYSERDLEKTGALIKFAALIETGTSLFAFLFLVLTAEIGSQIFLDDPSLKGYILFFGLTILTSFAMETANGVMRIINRYRAIALVSLIQNVVVALLVLLAAKTGQGLEAVLFAYFFGKVILGLVPVVLDLAWLPRFIGKGWWKAPMRLINNKKEILRFTVSTNISSTINLLARDGEILWVGALLSPLYAGYYKTAMTVINMVLTPINPFIDTTYPEMMRAITRKNWNRLRRLLSKVTVISFGWTFAVFLGLLLFGRQLLFHEITIFNFSFHVFQTKFLPAYEIIMILMGGYGIANIFFWNRTLLLAFSKADMATRISFIAMLIKCVGTVVLVPGNHYTMESVLLSAYLAGSVIVMTVYGLLLLKKSEQIPAIPEGDAAEQILEMKRKR